jgi:hypothetical protein
MQKVCRYSGSSSACQPPLLAPHCPLTHSCTLLAACLTYLTNTLAQGERDALLQRAGGPGGGEEAERLRAVVARLRSELLRKEAALGAAVADLEKVRDSLLDRHKSSVFSVYLKKLRLTV